MTDQPPTCPICGERGQEVEGGHAPTWECPDCGRRLFEIDTRDGDS